MHKFLLLKNLPHLRNELACIRMTNMLSLEDCRRMFPRVRRSGTRQARQIVAEYMADRSALDKIDFFAATSDLE